MYFWLFLTKPVRGQWKFGRGVERHQREGGGIKLPPPTPDKSNTGPTLYYLWSTLHHLWTTLTFLCPTLTIFTICAPHLILCETNLMRLRPPLTYVPVAPTYILPVASHLLYVARTHYMCAHMQPISGPQIRKCGPQIVRVGHIYSKCGPSGSYIVIAGLRYVSRATDNQVWVTYKKCGPHIVSFSNVDN